MSQTETQRRDQSNRPNRGRTDGWEAPRNRNNRRGEDRDGRRGRGRGRGRGGSDRRSDRHERVSDARNPPIVPQRLRNLYSDIYNSNLVNSSEFTQEFIDEFQTLLNEAQPQNSAEVIAKRTIFELYHIDNRRNSLLNLIFKNNNYAHLILWTEAKHIVQYFRLSGKVFIGWNQEQGKYSVSFHGKLEQKRKTTPEHKSERKVEVRSDTSEATSAVLDTVVDNVTKSLSEATPTPVDISNKPVDDDEEEDEDEDEGEDIDETAE